MNVPRPTLRGLITAAGYTGWLLTAGAWWASDAATPADGHPAQHRPTRVDHTLRPAGRSSLARASRPAISEEARLRARQALHATPRVDATPVSEASSVTPAALDAARAELRAEMEARHAEHEEARLAEQLDQIAAFAEAQGLSDEARAGVEDAVMALHEQMAAHRPPPPWEQDGPPDEATREAHRTQRRETFEAFDDALSEVLTDDQREALHDTLRPPRGPRHR